MTRRGWITAVLGCLCACARKTPEVVVYTSVDQVFSEPVLARFEAETGVRVRAVYDTEEAKSTGVVNRLIAESANPQADVFWSGDVFRCLVLKTKGVLAPHAAPATVPEPGAQRVGGGAPTQQRMSFRDNEGYWTGFSGRARVLVYRRDNVTPPLPRALQDFTRPERKGQLAVANPLFGTTTVHVAALFVALGEPKARSLWDALKSNGVRMVGSNSETLRAARDGEVAFGLTDSDDAFVALKDGAPLGLVFPDQDDVGTLFMPNAVALIRGAPHAREAARLIAFLLTPEVESMLRESAGQIPVLSGTEPPDAFGELGALRFMRVDYVEVAKNVETLQPYLKRWAGLE